VSYASQEKAWEFFTKTYEHNSGLGLFQGPSLSGKTTFIRHFASQQKEKSAVAVVNGAGINTTALLENVLRDFGYEHKFDSVNELLNMLKVFIQHQTASGQPPLLIVENIHLMRPSALRVLCELATVRVREKFALRMILASDRPIDYLVKAPAMECMTNRLTGDFHLDPLTMDETSDYLYKKLRYGGCLDPDHVFPDEICDELYRASGGWPGVVDRLALLAIAKAFRAPIEMAHIEHPTVPASTRHLDAVKSMGEPEVAAPTTPVLCVTHNGKTLKEVKFEGSRLLVGRSEHNDVQIENKYISRHHVLLVRHGPATLLMDLNSANGTFVNSWRVSNHVLAHDDVITLGEHGIKFVDAGAKSRAPMNGVNFDETVVMKTVEDMRRMLARENTEIMKVPQQAPESSGDTA
jgi:type II secretory pathway predicted ATPase ExeA